MRAIFDEDGEGTCATCAFWCPLSEHARSGECRRFPPVIVSSMVRAPTRDMEEHPSFIERATRYPIVGDHSQCGEWMADDQEGDDPDDGERRVVPFRRVA